MVPTLPPPPRAQFFLLNIKLFLGAEQGGTGVGGQL